MQNCQSCLRGGSCPMAIGRRQFLGGVVAGASALAIKAGLLDFASAMAEETPKPAGKPKVRAVFLYPKDHRKYWMSWPGHTYDVAGSQALYIKTMTEAAGRLDVQLEVQTEPIETVDEVGALLGRLKQDRCDGAILTVMHMSWWEHVSRFVKNKGDLPAVVFAPLGTAFTGHLQETRKAPKTFAASTQDIAWLAKAVRMFRTMWVMKNTRLCYLHGTQAQDETFPTIGTTLHHVPRERWPLEVDKMPASDEARAIADYYAKEAKKIIEPQPQDILNAAVNYLVAKRIMAAENCQGISLDCLGLVAIKRIACPPCIAWSRLLDEGGVGTCEVDHTAGISQLLTAQLIGRPGFMQDPVPNTVSNTFMGAHCTSATRLAGFDQPHMPFALRNHDESGMGCVPQVFWPVGQEVTVMKFTAADAIILATGRILANNDQVPGCGGCRTSVELALDGVVDARDIQGFHQLIILGRHDHDFRAYAQLAGIKVRPIA